MMMKGYSFSLKYLS